MSIFEIFFLQETRL